MREILDFLKSRQSETDLHEPAPSKEELYEAVAVGMAAPDYGSLKVWRFVCFSGEQRANFGRVLADIKKADGGSAAEVAKSEKLLMRAPMVVAVLAEIAQGVKIPAKEQAYGVCATTVMFQLALKAQGYESIWRSGWLVNSKRVKQALGVADKDEIIGFVYIGSGESGREHAPRTAVVRKGRQVEDYVRDWHA